MILPYLLAGLAIGFVLLGAVVWNLLPVGDRDDEDDW